MRRPAAGSSGSLVSLFTGAGGLDLGLEQAGFTTVAASELEHHACETLRANQLLGSMPQRDMARWFELQLAQRCYKSAPPEAVAALRGRLEAGRGTHSYLEHAAVLEGDVRKLTSDDLMQAAQVSRGELDLMAGGPPCTTFSRSGKRETVEHAVGQLFLDFVRLVDGVRPRWVLFENVKGLAQSKTTVWRYICGVCGLATHPPFDESREPPTSTANAPACGCGSTKTTWEVTKEKRGGSLDLIVAEFERIGYRCDWRVLNAADFGAPQQRERIFLVGSRDDERFEWPQPTHTKPTSRPAPSLPTLFATADHLRPWVTMREALWREGHPVFGDLSESAVLWIKNLVRPHAEPVTWTLDRPAPTVGAHQAAKFALAPDGVPPEQLRRQQWHTRGRRQRDFPPVAVKHEYLTDEDLLRLQTFPPSWYLYGTRMQRAFQVGNAVPCVLARSLGASLLRSGVSSLELSSAA